MTRASSSVEPLLSTFVHSNFFFFLGTKKLGFDTTRYKILSSEYIASSTTIQSFICHEGMSGEKNIE